MTKFEHGAVLPCSDDEDEPIVDEARLSSPPLALGDPMLRAMSQLSAELRAEPLGAMDLDRIERSLFAALDAQEGAAASVVVLPRRHGRLATVVAGLAIAAAASFVLWPHTEAPSLPVAQATVTTSEVPGVSPAAVQIATGEREEHFAREGLASWAFEPGSKATVLEHDGLVEVALAEGAIRVEVVPQPVPERFIVVAGETRVAVHGTRFRVARGAEKVEVDVEHGVVSVGAKSAAASAAAVLVTAPQGGTFGLDGKGGELRALVPFSEAPAAVLDAPPQKLSGKPVASARQGRTLDEAALRASLASAASRCFAQNARLSPDLNITVVTSLTFELGGQGRPHGFSFSPELAPGVMSCFHSATASLKGPQGPIVMQLELASRR